MTKVSLYRDTIKKAVFITKKYHYLWLLGFLAALAGNGGELGFMLTQFNKASSGAMRFGDGIIASFGTGGSNVIELFENLFSFANNSLLLIVLLFFLLFIFIWFALSAQGGLIRAIASAGSIGSPKLKENFFKGIASFAPLLAIVLSTRIGALFIAIVVGFPLASILIYFINVEVVEVLVVFAIGIPLLIIASLISKYAICFHMLEGKEWKHSINSALRLFSDNWLISIELAIILFVINIFAGAVIVILIFVFSAPFILAGYFLQDNFQNIAISVLWVGEVAVFILLLVLGSILATFQYACWTELYLKIRKGKHLSKIMRLVVAYRDKYR